MWCLNVLLNCSFLSVVGEFLINCYTVCVVRMCCTGKFAFTFDERAATW